MLKYELSTHMDTKRDNETTNRYVILHFSDKKRNKDLDSDSKAKIKDYVKSMGNVYELYGLHYNNSILKIKIRIKLESTEEKGTIIQQFEERHLQKFIDFYEENIE